MRKEGRYYCRGPSILSSEEVERLVKLGDKVDQALCERKIKRQQLKSACKKVKEDVRKFVEDEVCYFSDEVPSRSFPRYTPHEKRVAGFGVGY